MPIEHLTPEEKWLVERHYRDEMPVETIAREIKTSYRSCKRIHARAKELLAKRLRGFGPEDP